MFKKILLKPVLTALCAATFFSASATIHIIEASNYQFSPDTLLVLVGDTIRWNWVNGTHTTTSEIIPIEADLWDADLTSGSPIFDYKVTAVGIYSYKCEPHENMGMTGIFTAAASPTGVDERSIPPLQLFPNPFTDELYINSDEDIQLSISDILGKQVSNYTISKAAEKTRIETTLLPPGIYIVSINREGSKSKSIKVVKAAK